MYLGYPTHFSVPSKLILLLIVTGSIHLLKNYMVCCKANNRKLLIIYCRWSPLLFLLLIKIVKNELYLKPWSKAWLELGVFYLSYPLNSYEVNHTGRTLSKSLSDPHFFRLKNILRKRPLNLSIITEKTVHT